MEATTFALPATPRQIAYAPGTCVSGVPITR